MEASLPTQIGNEYQDTSCVVDLHWFVGEDEAGNLSPLAPTGDTTIWLTLLVVVALIAVLTAASCALFVGVSHSWFTQSTLNSGNKISVVEASGASDSQPASAPDAQDADSQKPGDASSGSSASIDAEGSDGGSSADGVDSGDASGAGSVTESAGRDSTADDSRVAGASVSGALQGAPHLDGSAAVGVRAGRWQQHRESPVIAKEVRKAVAGAGFCGGRAGTCVRSGKGR